MEADFSSERLAPVIRHELVSFLGEISCSGECSLQACTQDRHHQIFGSDLTEAERLLKSHPDFILPNICRDKHMKIHKQFDRSEPLSDEFVVGFLTASPLNLTPKKRQQLKTMKRGLS